MSADSAEQLAATASAQAGGAAATPRGVPDRRSAAPRAASLRIDLRSHARAAAAPARHRAARCAPRRRVDRARARRRNRAGPAPGRDASTDWQRRRRRDRRPRSPEATRSHRARSLLFFDTETTGLAGGTGTRAFMIGAADWHDGALRVRQLLITHDGGRSGDARGVRRLAARRTRCWSATTARCYDAPLLATRYRLARHGQSAGGPAPRRPAVSRRGGAFAACGRTAGWRRSNASWLRRAARGRPARLGSARAWLRTCAAAARTRCAACSRTTTRTWCRCRGCCGT